MPEEIKLNTASQSLLDQVNELFPRGNVFVQFDEQQKSGYVRHDQAKTDTLPGGICITVTDVTAPNYTASHELLHLLMLLRGFPQIFFNLSLGKEELDDQLMLISTDLYDTAMHRVVVSEQRKHNLIDEQVEEEYLRGIKATIDPEKDGNDGMGTLRLLTLLDAMVFYGDHLDQYSAQLQKDYPTAYQAAAKMYQEMMKHDIKSPFDMRRQIVLLYRLFDQQLLNWGLPAVHNNEFTTLNPVLSKRQLHLQVRQVFEIFHSDMKDRHGHSDIYVGLMRNDQQNSFVMKAPKGKGDARAQAFVKIYDESVAKLLTNLNMPYGVRK